MPATFLEWLERLCRFSFRVSMGICFLCGISIAAWMLWAKGEGKSWVLAYPLALLYIVGGVGVLSGTTWLGIKIIKSLKR